jgi:hypothetical protein
VIVVTEKHLYITVVVIGMNIWSEWLRLSEVEGVVYMIFTGPKKLDQWVLIQRDTLKTALKIG